MDHPKSGKAPGNGLEEPGYAPAAGAPPRPGPGSRREGPPLLLVAGMTLIVVAYSLLVLVVVASAGDLGVRCIFGTTLKEDIPADYRWQPERPRTDDELLRVGGVVIKPRDYTDFIQAQRTISSRVGDWIEVRWLGREDGRTHTAVAQVRRRPRGTYIWSLIWFLQEMVIFAVGARVYWKRPRDDSAALFFWLCVVTVGAFMGGYHWSVILIYRPLIFLFAPFAMLVPIISLHFYLVFPRANPIFVRHRRRVLGALYGVPAVYLGALWLSMLWSTLVVTYLRHPAGVARPLWLSLLGSTLVRGGGGRSSRRRWRRSRPWRWATWRWRSWSSGSASRAWSTASARRAAARSATRSSGSCWRRCCPRC
jgi:hypothetical protein